MNGTVVSTFFVLEYGLVNAEIFLVGRWLTLALQKKAWIGNGPFLSYFPWRSVQEYIPCLYPSPSCCDVGPRYSPENEPYHENMVLFVLRKLILQTRMRSHPVGLDVWFLFEAFFYFHTSCEGTAEALARLRGRAGSPSPSLVAYVISTKISWAGSNGCDNACMDLYWSK